MDVRRPRPASAVSNDNLLGEQVSSTARSVGGRGSEDPKPLNFRKPMPCGYGASLDRMAQDRERHQEHRAHAQSARRDAMATPRGPLRARSRRDLLDQCSAYACPMRAHAKLPRRTTSTCRSPRNRSSPATSRRAHPAYACVGKVDRAPRKSPDKPVDIARAPTQTCWSGECAYAKEREDPDELVAGALSDRASTEL